MRLALLLAVGCGFHHGNALTIASDAEPDVPPDMPVPIDVAIDAPPISDCASDPNLVVCYSFDANPLPASLPNEGSATATAQLTNVTSTASPGGRAALLGATSEIYVPYSATVTGVQSMEVWFRVDQDAAAGGGREGLFDSNVPSPSNISLFYYNQSPSPYQLRCGIGSSVIVLDAPGFAIGQWQYVACVCTGSAIAIYLNGTSLGATAATCSAGGGFSDPDGFTIGSNNNGGATGVNDLFIGAIDSVKLSSHVLTAQEVCAHAGRTGC